VTETVEGWPSTRAQVMRTALSVGVATGAYGVSFGALGVAAGLSVVQTCAMSVLLFTGGSQFALIGALAGSVIGDPAALGLDAAAPAAFLALLWPRLNSRPTWLTALTAALVAVLAVPFVPAGVPVLIAALVPAIAVLDRRRAA